MATGSARTHIALLRGINVGGHHKMPMARLRELFAAAGATAVRSYIQSGNVLFETGSESAPAVVAGVGEAVRDEFGFEVPIVLRSADELAAVVAACPFRVSEAQQKLLHVAFLRDLPSPERAAALDPARATGDRFELIGREVYIHYGDGAARSKLTNAYLDRTLATISTSRNWRTTRTLLEMATG